MRKLTRRRFLGQTTAGAATISTLATLPGLATAVESPATLATENTLSVTALSDTLVAHIRDFTTGEISLLVGTREIVYRDPELVGRLLKAIQ